MMSILLCYDGSPSAKRSLGVAGRVLGDEPAVLLHVWAPPERVAADAFAIAEADDGPEYGQLEESARRRAHEILSEGQELADRVGVAVTQRDQRSGDSISDTILEVADELNAELIVAGTHGTTAVQNGLLGSVSNALVHKAHRPVLVVPARDDAS